MASEEKMCVVFLQVKLRKCLMVERVNSYYVKCCLKISVMETEK